MSNSTTTERILSMQKKRVRQERMSQGFYDGRFAPKVVKDKRKHSSKFACRNHK